MARADGAGGTPKSIGATLGSVAKKAAKTVTRTPKTTRVIRSASRSSGSRGSSGGGSGGSYRSGGGGYRGTGGGTGNKGGSGGNYKPPKAPKKPATPDINSYLGTDSVYQDAVRGGQRTLKDFLSDLGRRRGEASTQFNDTRASMEKDRIRQLDEIRQEFASRGLIQSGLFGEEQGRFQQTFTDQMNALQKQQAALLADLLAQETNFKREQELALEAAKQEALQRRAAKYNIGG